MSWGTYLTHRLDPKGLALNLADVSRLSLLDHTGKFTPMAFKLGRGRIRGHYQKYDNERPDPGSFGGPWIVLARSGVEAVELVEPASVPRVVPNDPDDDHVIAAAVTAHASFIVSGAQALQVVAMG